MNSVMATLVVAGLLATLGVLFFGLFTMARGGEFNARHSNRIMRWRIIFQALTVLAFVTMLLFTKNAGPN